MAIRILLGIFSSAAAVAVLTVGSFAAEPTVRVSIPKSGGHQIIDGFGSAMSGATPGQAWFSHLYFDDLGASIERVDLTPQFRAPYSGENGTYNSPWFHNNPPMPGPDKNNVRAYKDAADYQRPYNGWVAKIAVMGPDIDENIKRCFDYDGSDGPGDVARLAAAAQKRVGTQNMKLIGSIWSPAPWVKIASGNTFPGHDPSPQPAFGTPFPFVWFNNFSGGMVDTSDLPVLQFDDSGLPGGTGPTSALTQFARCTAAYIKGYQDHFGVKFYSISIQNEPNLELFYSTCLYRTTDQYVAAVKAVRSEFDRHPDLKSVRIMGPEDTVGSESTYLWYWLNNGFKQAKFLQFMRAVESDPFASKAVAFYCCHGYAADGIQSAGAVPQVWDWVARGWDKAPNPSVPDNVSGYETCGKKCWMTETSGEQTDWISPKSGFPSAGAFSIALKIQQALTVGDVSAWCYWQTVDSNNSGAISPEQLTDSKLLANSPKFVAAKHFFKYIRPGDRRIDAVVSGMSDLIASSYINRKNKSLTVVLLNSSDKPVTSSLSFSSNLNVDSAHAFTSSARALWVASTPTVGKSATFVNIPGYGVETVVMKLK